MRRWFFRILYCGIGLTVLILAFYAEEDWRAKRDWEKYKTEWEAKGERFDLAAFAPPPTPDDQNFAFAPIVASTYAGVVDRNGNRIYAPNTKIVNRLDLNVYGYAPSNIAAPLYHHSLGYFGRHAEEKTYWPVMGNWETGAMTELNEWQRYFRNPKGFISEKWNAARAVARRNNPALYRVARRPLPESVRIATSIAMPDDAFPVSPQAQSGPEDVLLALGKFKAPLEELSQAVHLPHSRFPINYDDIGEFIIVVFPFTEEAQILALRAVAELAEKKPDKAFDDVNFIFGLAESIHSVPFTQTQHHRQNILRSALQVVWEGLATRHWSDDQLVAIDRQLAVLDFASDYTRALRASRAIACAEIDRLPPKPSPRSANTEEDFNQSLGESLGELLFRSIPRVWYVMGKIQTCEVSTELMSLWNEKNQTVAKTLVDPLLLPGCVPRYSSSNYASGSLFTAYEAARITRVEVIPYVQAQGSVNLARVACALERHYLRYQSYPTMLQALVPEFIDSLPHDLIDGKPIRYRQTPDGRFVLYSIDWTGKDKGGKVKENDMHEISGDWVWRYP